MVGMVSASEMTYIVSSGALNSTHSLTLAWFNLWTCFYSRALYNSGIATVTRRPTLPQKYNQDYRVVRKVIATIQLVNKFVLKPANEVFNQICEFKKH